MKRRAFDALDGDDVDAAVLERSKGKLAFWIV